MIRWHFTVFGYGVDCGFPGNVMAEYMGGNLFIQEDKSDLIFMLAAINDYYGNLDTDDVYETALALAADPLASADDILYQEELLEQYIEDTYFDVEDISEIRMYDGEKVYLSFAEEVASAIVIFADFEGGALRKMSCIPVDASKISEVDIPDDIELAAGDKIMLWDGFETCKSLCEAYVINGGEQN